MRTLEFGTKYDEVMIDEAWYYLRANGQRVRMIKNEDGTWSSFETIRTRSKAHINKVMYLAALSRPHPKYAAEPPTQDGILPISPHKNSGKIFMGSFTDIGYYTQGPKAGTEKIVNIAVNR